MDSNVLTALVYCDIFSDKFVYFSAVQIGLMHDNS